MKLRELQLYNQINFIGVQSKSNLNYFKTKKYFRRFKVEILYNWKIVGEKSKLNSDIRKQLKIGNKVLFVFGGNLGFAQDIDNLLRMASSMKEHPSFHLLFIGEGTQFKKIKKWIAEYRMENNVNLLPAVSNEKYQSILNECDVGVISLRKDLKTDNFPNKLLNYQEYKLPILASINPNNELSNFIKEKNIGLVCENGDDNQLLENVKSLVENKSQRERMGEQAFKLLKEIFDVKMAVKKILKVSST
jgi:glycosyltransferase involved in cell wall biosynthesis